MANTRLITSFLTYTPSATSEDASFLAANLKVYGHPFRPWKAVVATGIVDVTLDFGAGNTLSGLAANPGILIYPTNVSSVRIQGNSSLSWGSPPWDQLVAIAKDGFDGRYHGGFQLSDLDPAAFAYRYLNLRIPSQTPVDGLVYRIGDVVVGQITEWSVNPSAPLARPREDPALTVEMMDGGVEVLEMGEPFLTLRLPRKLYSATALNEHLDLAALGVGSPFVYFDAALNNSQSVWLVRRFGPSETRQLFVNTHEGELALRQVT